MLALLIFALVLYLNCDVYCISQQKELYKVSSSDLQVKSYTSLPDSLGGKSAYGDIILRIYRSKDINQMKYEVLRIRVITNPCKAAEYYGMWGSNFEESKKQGKIKGLKVLNRFKNWINENFMAILSNVDSSSQAYTRVDSNSFNYTIEINPLFYNSINKAITNYRIPIFHLPKNLGGKNIRGYFGVRMLWNSSGKIICWFPMSILATNKKLNNFKSYSETPPGSVEGDSLIHIYSSVIDIFLKKIKFDIIPQHWLFQEYNEIPLEIYVQINSKKVRDKNDLSFLLNWNN